LLAFSAAFEKKQKIAQKGLRAAKP